MTIKKVLITGITGMVGSHLADFLLKNTEWHIFGMCRWRSPLDNIETLVPKINKNERVTLLYGDLKDTISLKNVVKKSRPDYVYHLAAQSFPNTSFYSPLETMDTNALGTFRLLESLKEYSKEALIHICSSSEIFGRVPKEKVPIIEDCSFHPASPYAISKVSTDLAGRFYSEAYGMKVLVTRMFTHTGPRRGDVFAESTFAKQIAMIEHDLVPPIIKVGNLNSMRTVADVRDAVKAYYMLLTVNPIPGEFYNIGGSYSLTVGEILDELLKLTTYKKEIKVKQDEERMRPIDADLQIPNTEKFEKHTGWKPEIPFKKTITDLMNYWRHKVKKEGQRSLIR